MTGQALIIQGDALRLPLPDGSVDAVVCDPPYGLEFMGKEWDTFAPGGKRPRVGKADGSPMRRHNGTPSWGATGNPGCRRCGGQRYGNNPNRQCECAQPDFGNPMAGQMHAYQAWCEQWATDALRVLKPGGWLLAFGSTRTFHRLVCGLEDAGFEIRDTIAWLHGSGFPKSLNVSDSVTRSIPPDTRCSCAQRSTDTGSGSPAGYPSRRGSDDGQPRLVAEDGLASVPSPADAPGHSHADPPLDVRAAERASSGLDGGIGHLSTEGSPAPTSLPSEGSRAGGSARSDRRTSTSPDAATEPHRTDPRRPDTLSSDGVSPWRNQYISACLVCGGVKVQPGLGTALKPAIEFVSVARKPLAGTVAQNVLTFGTGALNIDASRIAGNAEAPGSTPPSSVAGRRNSMAGAMDRVDYDPTRGRWPSNVALVHSEGCQPTGTRKIRGAGWRDSDGGSDERTLLSRGLNRSGGRHHADADGMEEITAWTCETGHEETRTAVTVGALTVELEAAPAAELEDLAAALARRLRRLDSHTADTGSRPANGLGHAAHLTVQQGSPAGCPACSRSDDGLPPLMPEGGQASAQQLADALELALDLECSPPSSHQHLGHGHLSSSGDAPAHTTTPGIAGSRTHSPVGAAPASPLSASHTPDMASAAAGERPGSIPMSSRAGRLDDTTDTSYHSEYICRWRRSQVGLVARAAFGLGVLVSVRSYTVIVSACPVFLLDQQSGILTSGANPTRRNSDKFRNAYGDFPGQRDCTPARGVDQGGASRFFYTAKAGPNERVTIDGEGHPCVKPLSLMRWLVRLVTPPGGIILDMFAGSGTTGEAAMLEGFRCVLIDKDPANLPSIRVRTHPYVRRTKVVTNGHQVGPEQGSLL